MLPDVVLLGWACPTVGIEVRAVIAWCSGRVQRRSADADRPRRDGDGGYRVSAKPPPRLLDWTSHGGRAPKSCWRRVGTRVSPAAAENARRRGAREFQASDRMVGPGGLSHPSTRARIVPVDGRHRARCLRAAGSSGFVRGSAGKRPGRVGKGWGDQNSAVCSSTSIPHPLHLQIAAQVNCERRNRSPAVDQSIDADVCRHRESEKADPPRYRHVPHGASGDRNDHERITRAAGWRYSETRKDCMFCSAAWFAGDIVERRSQSRIWVK